MNLTLIIQCFILKAFRNAKAPLTRRAIEQYVITKMHGVRDNAYLKEKVKKELNLFLVHGALSKDSHGYYVKGSNSEADHDIRAKYSPNPICGELLSTVKKTCEKKTKSTHYLDPNKRVRRDGRSSDDSLSGDEFQRACKQLHTNTKRVKYEKKTVPLPQAKKFSTSPTVLENADEDQGVKYEKKTVPLPQAKKFSTCSTVLENADEGQSDRTKIIKTEDKNHICLLPENGLKAYEILTVVCPRTNACCGSMIFVPYDLRNSAIQDNNRANNLDKCEPPIKKGRFEDVDAYSKPEMDETTSNANLCISDNAPQTMVPDSDELKPPKYASSHENFKTGKRVKRLKRGALNFIQKN